MNRQKILILPKLHTYNGDVSKQWFVHYSFRDPATNRMKRFRVYDGFSEYKTASKKKEHGQKLIRNLKRKLLNGWSPFEDGDVIYSDNTIYAKVAREYGRMRTGKKTFNFYINEFLNSLSGVRPSTYTTYKSKFRYFQDFLQRQKIEDNHICAFSPEEAKEFNVYLKQTRKLSAKSINQYNVLLRSFYKWLISNNHVMESPFKEIKKLKVETKKPRIYTPFHIEKVTSWANKNDKQLLLVIRIIFNCLIRPGELRKLKVCDVNLVTGQIIVPAHVSKTAKRRVVDIPQYLVEEMVKLRINEYPDEYYFIGYKGKPSQKMIGKNNLYNRFVRMRKETEIPRDFILYAFKHTGMIELKLSGADWLEIKNQVGHQSLDQVIAYMTELMGRSSAHIKYKAPRI